jgi:hypothetical protein
MLQRKLMSLRLRAGRTYYSRAPSHAGNATTRHGQQRGSLRCSFPDDSLVTRCWRVARVIRSHCRRRQRADAVYGELP